MNHLTTKRLKKLVYILYNKRLQDRRVRLKSLKEGEDPLIVQDFSFDNEWVAGVEDEILLDTHDINDDRSSGQGIESSTSTQKQHKRKRSFSSKDNGKGKLHLVDEEDEWIQIESEDEEDDRRIRYDDNSLDDPTSDDGDDHDVLSEDF
ncbi:C-terminal dimerization domain containing protein [Abeliophyllum distichum]|uniref:C-terminal dimerization domain containing protein n=1 Tax=Abeliophyllum distichum TaxID=126358 RepID=A0ABD1RG01_9LAMI